MARVICKSRKSSPPSNAPVRAGRIGASILLSRREGNLNISDALSGHPNLYPVEFEAVEVLDCIICKKKNQE